MNGKHRSLLVLVLALGLVGAAAAGAAGDDVSTAHEGEDHSDGGDGGNFLPAPGPGLVLATTTLAAVGLRRPG